MFNKRVGTLLALVLASSMAMSGPAAVMAASGNSGGTSQTETREDQNEEEEEKEEFEEKADDVEADVKEDKTDTGDEEEPAGEEANEPLDPEWAEEEPEEEEPGEEVNEPSEKKDKKDSAEDKKEKKDKKTDKSEKEDVAEEKDKDVPRAKASGNETDKNSSSANKAGPFYLNAGVSENTDYEYKGNVLTILSSKAITISGNVSSGDRDRIVVNSATGAGVNLTLRNLTLHTASAIPALTVNRGPVNINLSGQNELSGVSNNGSSIKIQGPGVLKNGRGFNGTSPQATVISGGNIQTTFSRQPKNGAGTDLYAVSINNLEYSELYNLNVKIGDPLKEYPYGKEIRSDDDGNVFMYLPLGKVQVTLGASEVFEGEVVSKNGLPLRRVEPSNTPSPSPSTSPSATPTSTPRPTVSGEQPDIASATDNKIFWINAGATYRSGASLQFYATGAGYSPVDPQETNPVKNSTRFIPVSWSVVDNSNKNGASGKWKERDREVTTGGASSGNGSYTSAEYRFKDSFTLSTNQASAVPYTLKVSYQKETYNGRAWKADNGAVDTKTVSFYIRNTDITTTVTGTPRPTSTTYVRSGVTSTALRRDISSNARNARTSDDTPIGTMIFLMFAAAGSGAVIFRKKRRS